jgi:hypothetical protein
MCGPGAGPDKLKRPGDELLDLTQRRHRLLTLLVDLLVAAFQVPVQQFRRG